ncbi:MAG: LytTR family DNA-binding domain-containing protein [Chitinophagales bacterium]|nr:LytTR family DNA-binding domain-containing protein [Chitinophagales bacterium]
MKYHCLIVDDEPLAQEVLESYIQKMPELALSHKCSNAIEALAFLRENEVQLLFLDIQMPEITGLEMVKSLKNPPAIIFTTAYPNYAVQGFEMDAMDYLVKPISFDRFVKGVNKAIHYLEMDQKESQQAIEEEAYIFVKADKKIVKIMLDDILYIEGLKDYIMIFTHDQRIITLQTMKNLEERLPSNKFMRIHRSFIISLDKLKSVVGNLVEIGNKQIPLGKNYRDDFMKIIEKHHFIK